MAGTKSSPRYTINSHYIEHVVVELCIPKFKNLILDLNKVQYSCWSTVFRDTARAYNLLHHIDTAIPCPYLSDQIINFSKNDDITQDAVVLTWIYATISPYLLARLLTRKPPISALDAWARLRDMCQQHDDAMQKKRKFIQIDLNEDYLGFEENVNDNRVDLLSNLPDDVLIYMLSLANDVKTVGRTSILSKRWRRVWTHLMDLDFNDPLTIVALKSQGRINSDMDKFVDRVFVDMVNRVIAANRAPYLNSFRINFPLNSSYAAYIHNWLKFACSKEVRNLALIFKVATYPMINFFDIFSSNPALILNTTLKTLHLESVTIYGPLLQWVLTNCLNLQRLSIHSCAASPDDAASSKHQLKLMVLSPVLKHLEFFHCLEFLNIKALHLSASNLTSFVFYETETDVEYHSIPSLVDATLGGPCFPHLDTLSRFSSQLQKLSIRWFKVNSATGGFPTFVNVRELEIVVGYCDADLIHSTSLIEACPLLHTFQLKMMCMTQIQGWPYDAQINVMCSHQHLKTVKYAGYAGSASADDLALCLSQHAPMLRRFIFHTRRPTFIGKPPATNYMDRTSIVRRTQRLAKRIQGSNGLVDVVIL